MSESLQNVSIQFARILSPIIIILGVIGNTLNINILIQPNFRRHSCCRYFLALSCNNLFYCLFQINFYLANAYSLDGQYVSLASCKILQYIASSLSFLSPCFIVLASIDRFFSSSRQIRFRRWSSIPVSHWSISTLLIFTGIFFINVLIFYDLRFDDGLGCNMRGDEPYKKAFIIIQVVLYAGLPPCFMIIFGILTALNLKQMKNFGRDPRNIRRREIQFIRMLLIQIMSYLLLNVPLCILYLLLVLPFGYAPTDEFIFVYTILSYPFNFAYATPFLLYILSAKQYRDEFFNFIHKVFSYDNGNRIEPILTLNERRRFTSQLTYGTRNW